MLRSLLCFRRLCGHSVETLFTSSRSIYSQYYPGSCCFATATTNSMSLRVLALLGLASLAAAAPNIKPSASTVNKRYVEERNGVTYNVFKRAGEASSLSYVKNSGICETTPGVDQYSGYLDVGTDMHSKQYPALLAPLPSLRLFELYRGFLELLPMIQKIFATFSSKFKRHD